MSQAKRQLEKKAATPKKSRLERKVERLGRMDSAFEKNWNALWSAYNDYEMPLTEFRVYLREGGDMLGLVKREVGTKEEIIFSGADDFLECLDNLNNAIAADKWKKERPRGSN